MAVEALYGFENQVVAGDGEYFAGGRGFISTNARDIDGNGGERGFESPTSGTSKVVFKGPGTNAVRMEFAYFLPAAGTTNAKITFYGGNEGQCAIEFNLTTGCVSIFQGLAPTLSGTLLGVSKPVIVRDKWLFFHVDLVCDDSVGIMDIYMNGNTTDPIVSAGINADTRRSTSDPAEIQAIHFDLSRRAVLDDLVIIDASDGTPFLGGALIVKRTPTANGTDNTWAPSAGNNFDAVNVVPPSSTNNTSSSVDAASQTFVMSAMPAWVGAVLGTMSRFVGNHQGPSLSAVEERVRDGATTDNNSVAVTMPFTTGASSAPFRTLDANGVAWTPASADEFGFSVVSP